MFRTESDNLPAEILCQILHIAAESSSWQETLYLCFVDRRWAMIMKSVLETGRRPRYLQIASDHEADFSRCVNSRTTDPNLWVRQRYRQVHMDRTQRDLETSKRQVRRVEQQIVLLHEWYQKWSAAGAELLQERQRLAEW